MQFVAFSSEGRVAREAALQHRLHSCLAASL